MTSVACQERNAGAGRPVAQRLARCALLLVGLVSPAFFEFSLAQTNPNLATLIYQAPDHGLLDDWISKGDSLRVVAQLPRELGRDPIVTNWIKSKAEQGHPHLQMEYGWTLNVENPGEALRWYVMGRLAFLLDGAECKNTLRRETIEYSINYNYARMRKLAAEQPALYSQALRTALTAEKQKKSTPQRSPKWACGFGTPESPDADLLGTNARTVARAKKLQDIEVQGTVDVALLKAPPPFEKQMPWPHKSVPTQGTPEYRMQWLDNDRLIFVGVDPTRTYLFRRLSTPPIDTMLQQEVVWIWDVNKDQKKMLFDVGPNVYFCLSKGNLHVSWVPSARYTEFFSLPDHLDNEKWGQSDYWRHREGPWDKTSEGQGKLFFGVPPRTYQDSCVARFDNRGPVSGQPGQKLDGVTLPLTEADGFMIRRGNKVTMNPPNRPKQEFIEPSQSNSAAHYQYLDLYGGQNYLTMSKPGSRYFMAVGVDGRQLVLTTPPTPFLQTIGGQLSRAGLVVSGGNPVSWTLGGGGVYLLDGANIHMILRGQVGDYKVSPDGCKVAARLADNAYPDQVARWKAASREIRSELQVTDLCQQMR